MANPKRPKLDPASEAKKKRDEADAVRIYHALLKDGFTMAFAEYLCGLELRVSHLERRTKLPRSPVTRKETRR